MVNQRTPPGEFCGGGSEGTVGVNKLRPHWLARLVILLPFGPLAVLAAQFIWTYPDGTGLVAALVVCPFSVYIMVRWIFFMGVRRDGTSLVVSGSLWSRRIPLDRIERVTDFYVFVWWRTRFGARVFTPLLGFTAREGTLESVARKNAAAISIIRAWVIEEHGSPSPQVVGGHDER